MKPRRNEAVATLVAAGFDKSEVAEWFGVSKQRVCQIVEPHKTRARAAVQAAVERGDLDRPDACERCGIDAARIEGHHPDYAKPLVVEWLCKPCHAAEDRRFLGRKPSSSDPTIPFGIRAPESLLAALEAVAETTGITRSETAAHAIELYVARRVEPVSIRRAA